MFRKLEPEQKPVTTVTVILDGASIVAEAGEPVAAILLRTSPFTARTSPVGGGARGPFCMMGACFECLVEVDGIASTRACLVRARDGLVVRRRAGRPDPLALATA